MTYTEDDLWHLIDEASNMPYGAARTALLEQVMAHADAMHAEAIRFDVRMRLTGAYNHGGEPGKSPVTFAWCLSAYDRDPAAYTYATRTLLWHFKYIASIASRFPQISRERFTAILDDMERRYREGGHSMHAVYTYRHLEAWRRGDEAAAEEWFGKWLATPADDLSDCAGCDPTNKVSYLAATGRDDEAIMVGAPVLEGTLSCSEQPQSILTELMLPYARTGRLELARDAHRRAYRAHRSQLADLGAIATHVVFCAVTGNEVRGLEIVERHLPWLPSAPSPMTEMSFAAAAALVLGRVTAAGHGDEMVQRPIYRDRPAGRVTVAALAEELEAVATEIAGQFDARNGTSAQSAEIARTLAAENVVDYLPLSPLHQVRPSPFASLPAGSAGATSSGTVAAPPAAEAPVTVARPVAIPSDATADEILDRCEEAAQHDDDPTVAALTTAFDECFADADLTAAQRGRRADLHGWLAVQEGHGKATAQVAWQAAIERYAEAGDEVRRQTARMRLAFVIAESGHGDEAIAMAEEAAGYLLSATPTARHFVVLQRLAGVHGRLGRFDEALTVLDRAADVVEATETPWADAKWRLDRAFILTGLGRVDEANGLATEARELSHAAGYRRGIEAATMLVGQTAQWRGDAAAAVAAYDEVLAMTGDADMREHVRTSRAMILATGERAAEAIDDLVEAVANATAQRDDESGYVARYHLAIAYLNTGRPLDAADLGEELVAALSDGHPLMPRARHVLATTYEQIDQPELAIAQFEALAKLAEEAGDALTAADTHKRVAEMLYKLDRDASAAQHFGAASTAYREAGRLVQAVNAARRSAISSMYAHEFDEALATIGATDELVVALPDGGDAEWERAAVLFDGGRILRARKERSAAIARCEAAVKILGGLGKPATVALIHVNIAEILIEDGRAAEAGPSLIVASRDGNEAVRRRAAEAAAQAGVTLPNL